MDFLGLNLAQVPTKSTDWKAYIIPFFYVLISIISMKITMVTNPNKNKDKECDYMAIIEEFRVLNNINSELSRDAKRFNLNFKVNKAFYS